MENRKITVEEVIKEDERHLLYSIKDDKAELLKVVQKAIKDLQKLEDDLTKYADNAEYQVRTDLDNKPMILDTDRLDRYSRRLNKSVEKLDMLLSIKKAINGELEG